MNIFSEVKEYLTARQVAENYGLQVQKKWVMRCPFHDDKHPSMKMIRTIIALLAAWEGMRLTMYLGCLIYRNMRQH